MPRSMTGFGVATGPAAGGRLQCEIRTVNHKHLNVQLRVPSAVQPLESSLREALRSRFTRGHASLQLRWIEEPAREAPIRLDLDRAQAVADALRTLRDTLGLTGELDLNMVARFPEVLSGAARDETPPEIPSQEVLAIVAEACEQVLVMREREGAALAAELQSHLDALAADLATVKQAAPERVTRERDRLRAAVVELVEGREVSEERLAQELAFLAEKLDVHEETVRLDTHLDAARNALTRDEPIGRELGFLGQEMLREINTIGSKANDAGIAHRVIAMKGTLERFREQLENLE